MKFRPKIKIKKYIKELLKKKRKNRWIKKKKTFPSVFKNIGMV